LSSRPTATSLKRNGPMNCLCLSLRPELLLNTGRYTP
jgi:hypothetical protein